MGWRKRGNGRSYDSLNGYGAIIGFLSGNVLDFATRNRKCKKCDAGRDERHDCRKNFSGSAKAMEADVGTQLVNNSSILRAVQSKVRVVIGDEDSSTIAAIRCENADSIFKLADGNHLRKGFVGDLYKQQAQFKELKKREVIPHIKKCFAYAIAHNECESKKLATTLRTIPDHIFGQHENCADWCEKMLHTILLQDRELYKSLSEIFEKYANNAAKFCVAASSQCNESLNGSESSENSLLQSQRVMRLSYCMRCTKQK